MTVAAQCLDLRMCLGQVAGWTRLGDGVGLGGSEAVSERITAKWQIKSSPKPVQVSSTPDGAVTDSLHEPEP